LPPPVVPKRIREFILYYYAKLVIAPSSGQKENYKFIIDRYKRLVSGEINMSDYDREIQKLAQQPGICVFCNSPKGNVVVELIPRQLGGPIGIQNTVYACEACAKSKSELDLLEWWCVHLGRNKDELPRVPAGLFLKMAYERHAIAFTLRRRCNDIKELWFKGDM
jgi:hypothetical protein